MATHAELCARRLEKYRVQRVERKAREEAKARHRQRVLATSYTRHMWTRYGLTPDGYLALMAAQGCRCAICGVRFGFSATPYIDHSHKTGQVRGLLCCRCNTGIGQLGDDERRLQNAIVYLNREKEAA